MAQARRVARGYLALSLGSLLLVGAAFAWYATPVTYEVYALLKVSSKPPKVLDNSGKLDERFEIFKRTQVQLVRSPRVLVSALGDPKIARLPTVEKHKEDSPAWLSEQLSIDYPGNAEIMRIAIKGKNPTDLQKIVDRVIKKYLEEVVYNDKETNRLEEDKVRKSLDDSKRELGKLMDNFKKQQQLLGVNPEALTLQRTIDEENLKLTLFQIRDLDKELAKNAMEIVVANARQAEADESRPNDSKPAKEMSVPILEKVRTELEKQLAAAKETFGEQTMAMLKKDVFNADLETRQQDITYKKRIVDELQHKLDLADVERMAPERISTLDQAILASSSGDNADKRFPTTIFAVLGLVFLGLGLWESQSPRSA